MNEPTHSHLHRCQCCGTLWGHGDMMGGDIEAHACPKCGKSDQWRVFRGGGNPVAVMHRAPQPTGAIWILAARLVVVMGLVIGAVILWRLFAAPAVKAGK